MGRDDDRGQDEERRERDRLSPGASPTGRAEGVAHRDEPPHTEQDDEDQDRQRGRGGEQSDEHALWAAERLEGDNDQHDEEREAEDQC